VPLITSLREGPWADPAARLVAATEAEPILKKELAWLEAGGEAQMEKPEELAGRYRGIGCVLSLASFVWLLLLTAHPSNTCNIYIYPHPLPVTHPLQDQTIKAIFP